MKKKNKRSISQTRRIHLYLKHRTMRLLKADTKLKMRKISEHTRWIVEHYYESLSEIHQRELLTEYDRLEKLNQL